MNSYILSVVESRTTLRLLRNKNLELRQESGSYRAETRRGAGNASVLPQGPKRNLWGSPGPVE
jgi:hypothetical protein